MQSKQFGIAVSVLAPTALVSTASTALLPVIPAIVGSAGEGLALAGGAVATLMIGQVLGAMPGGLVSGWRGDRITLALSGGIGATGAAVVLFSQVVPVYFLMGFLLMGIAAGFHSVARHAYLTDSMPEESRSEALARVSGMLRGGAIVGPFAASGLLTLGLSPLEVSFVAIIAFAAVALLHVFIPVSSAHRESEPPVTKGVIAQLTEKRGRLIQVAVASSLVSGLRAGRILVVPLWGSAVGMEASLVALVVGLAAVADFLVFPIAGRLMYSRSVRAAGGVSTFGLTVGVLALCIASEPEVFAVVAVGLGLASGLGSGYLLAVASVEVQGVGRTGPVLGALRTISDGASAVVPLAVGFLAAVAALVPATLALGLVGIVSSVLTQTVLRPLNKSDPLPKE